MNIYFFKNVKCKVLIIFSCMVKKKYGSKNTKKYCLLYTILLWLAKSWIIYFLYKSVVFFFYCFVQIIGCLAFYLMYEMFVEAWRVYNNKMILIYVLVKITNELNWILINFFFVWTNKQTNDKYIEHKH